MTGDGARVFYAEGNLAEVRDLFMLDVASGQRTQVLKAGKDVCFPCLYEARFSPDNRWGAFHHATSAGTRGIVLVPFRDGKLVEAESILVTDKAGEGVPNWSPDGNLLYMVSNRDGYFCIWAQPLDPASKKPKGDLIPVQHFPHAEPLCAPARVFCGARQAGGQAGGRIQQHLPDKAAAITRQPAALRSPAGSNSFDRGSDTTQLRHAVSRGVGKIHPDRRRCVLL